MSNTSGQPESAIDALLALCQTRGHDELGQSREQPRGPSTGRPLEMHSNLTISRRTVVAASTALALGALPRWTWHAQAQSGNLVFWDSHNSGGMQEIVEALAEEFEAQKQGVTVEHQGFETAQLDDQLQRAVQSGEGPDISQINKSENSTCPRS